VLLEGKRAATRNVVHIDEVARLVPVLEMSGARSFSKREEKMAAAPVYGLESA